jgi:membrane protein DedA with SNARE-associated domain/rhodanese-related sulfurtransferase
MDHVIEFLVAHGLPILFLVILLEQTGLPIPAAPWLLAVGALSATGKFNAVLGALAVMVACLIADSLWFYLGRRRGTQVLQWLCRISLEPDSCVRRTQNLFTRYGLRAMLVAKFVPGLGTVSAPLAGMSGLPLWRFLFVDAIGSLFYGSTYLLLGRIFSAQIHQIADAFEAVGAKALLLLGGALAAYIAFKFWQRHKVLRELRMARISVEELRQKQTAGEKVVLLDLRSVVELARDPTVIPGAVLMRLDELEARQHEIPRDGDVIVYCSCPNEESSARLALLMRRKGFKQVRPLRGGIDAWREQKFPLETRRFDAPSAAPASS